MEKKKDVEVKKAPTTEVMKAFKSRKGKLRNQVTCIVYLSFVSSHRNNIV